MADPDVVLELTTSGPTKPPRGSRKTWDDLTPQEREEWARRFTAGVASPTAASIEQAQQALASAVQSAARLVDAFKSLSVSIPPDVFKPLSVGITPDAFKSLSVSIPPDVFKPLSVGITPDAFKSLIESLRVAATGALQELVLSVTVALPRLDELGTPWGDALLAGDPERPEGVRREAALRLAQFLEWPAGPYTRHLVELRARHEGRSPAAVREEVYAQAVLAALSEPGDQLPVYVGDRPLTTPDGRALTAGDGAGDVPFWRWLREEVAWGAEDILLGRPYSPKVRLEAPPPEDGPLPLVRRATVSLLLPASNNGGAPRLEERPDRVQAILDTLVRVYERQRRYGLSLRAAARYVGVPESTIRTWERELQERGIPLPK